MTCSAPVDTVGRSQSSRRQPASLPVTETRFLNVIPVSAEGNRESEEEDNELDEPVTRSASIWANVFGG